jgi:hydroxylamine reductase (hybrid-cluster protein)
MFCYQCQETAKGTGCEVRGVCGKTEEVAMILVETFGIAGIGNVENDIALFMA